MKTLAAAATLFFAYALTTFAADANKLAASYETLRTTTIFAFGGVGYAGQRVPAEFAFNEIVKADNAVALFEKLLPSATPEGQMYALVGLYRIDHKAFKDAVPPYLVGSMDVNTASGCMLYKQPAKGLVERIKVVDYK